MHVIKDSFSEVYDSLAELLNTKYEYVPAPRQQDVRECLGVSFKIIDPRDRAIFNTARNFKAHYTVAETLWYLSGDDKTSWISYYAPFWNSISDDGETANSAYGARIFRTHDRVAGSQFVQWEWVKNELMNDPDSRRALIHIKSPSDSIHAKLDVPCTLALQFLIRDEQLHLIVNMRSSDLILGIANDVPAFTTLQEVMALELGVELGSYIHVSNSLHVYERNFDMLSKMCEPTNREHARMLHARVGPHPAMPSLPPVDELMAYEKELRYVDDVDELVSIVKATDFGQYWTDWALMLASHRARKLNKKDAASRIAAMTFFEG